MPLIISYVKKWDTFNFIIFKFHFLDSTDSSHLVTYLFLSASPREGEGRKCDPRAKKLRSCQFIS